MMGGFRKSVIALLLLALCAGAPRAQQETFSAFVAGLPAAAAPVGGEALYVIQNGVARQVTLASLRAAVLTGAGAISPTTPAQAQGRETFSSFVNGLPQAVLPFSGNETVYLLQNGVSTRTTIAALLGAGAVAGPTQPALLPADPLAGATINLDFANASYLGCTPSSCLSVVRSDPMFCPSLSTYPGLIAIPPSTVGVTDLGLCVGIPTSITNLLSFSEQIDNAAWTLTGVTVAPNTTVAPDGNTTADAVTDVVGTTASFHGFTAPFSAVSGTAYYSSGFIKYGTGSRYIQRTFPFGQFGSSRFANFDVVACTVTATGAVNTVDAAVDTTLAGTIPIFGGGCFTWLKSTATSTATSSNEVVLIPYALATRGSSYIGTGANSLIVWGEQVSAGAAWPYVPTSGAPATRAGNPIQAAGALLTALSASQGFVVANINQVPFISAYALSRNGTVDAFLQITGNTQIGARVAAASVAPAPVGSFPFVTGGATNLGMGWDGSGVETVINGGPVSTSATPFGGSINAWVGSADGSTGGLGGFIRRLVVGAGKPSTAALQALAPVQGAPLGTPGTNWYISSAGSDSNNCKSSGAPCTVAAINSGKLQFLYSDTINFDGSAPITGCPSITAANMPVSSPSLPITVKPYNGAGFTLDSNCNGDTGILLVSGINGIVIQDGTFVGTGTTVRGGIYLRGPVNTVTVQRSTFNDIKYISSDFGADIFYNGLGGPIDSIQALNNTWVGLSGPTSTDRNGFSGFGSGQNITNVTVQGNIGSNIGGLSTTTNWADCITTSGMSAVLVQFNLCHDIGANYTTASGGPVAFISVASSNVTFQFLEAYNMTPNGTNGQDMDAFDFDIGATASLGQYLYSHNNFGFAYLHFVGTAGGLTTNGNTWRYSISEHDDTGHNASAGAVMQYNNSGLNLNNYNMTIWNNYPGPALSRQGSVGICCNLTGASTLSGLVANNIFAATKDDLSAINFVTNNGNGSIPAGLVFKNNDWFNISGTGTTKWFTTGTPTTLAGWQAVAPGGDSNATIASPQVTSGGSGGTCSWTPSLNNGPQSCPSAYALSGSNMKSAGTSIQAILGVSPGVRDYYGNTVPGSGSCWNIGADGTCP